MHMHSHTVRACTQESTCPHGSIHMSYATKALLDLEGEQGGTLEYTGGVEVKGKGRMDTYLYDPAKVAALPGPSSKSRPGSSTSLPDDGLGKVTELPEDGTDVPQGKVPASSRNIHRSGGSRRGSHRGSVTGAMVSGSLARFGLMARQVHGGQMLGLAWI